MNQYNQYILQLLFINLFIIGLINPVLAETVPIKNTDEKNVVSLSIGKNGFTFDISAQEKQLLDNYINRSSSEQFLTRLSTAVSDPQKEVRLAAVEVVARLLKSHPHLSTTTIIEKLIPTFYQGDADQWFDEGMLLLVELSNANPKTAPNLLNLALSCIAKQLTNKKPIPHLSDSQKLSWFFQTMAVLNPRCIPTMIKHAEEDRKIEQEARNEEYRMIMLYMLSSIAGDELVKDKQAYSDMLFKMALANHWDKSEAIQAKSVQLLRTMIHANPSYAQNAFKHILEEGKTDDSTIPVNVINDIALFVKADSRYIQPALEIATKNVQNTDMLVRGNTVALLNTIIRTDHAYIPHVLPIVINVLEQEKLPEQAYYYQNYTALWNALIVVNNVILINQQYIPKCLPVVIKATTYAESDPRIAIRALETLGVIIKLNRSFLPEAWEAANQATEHKYSEIKWTALKLMRAIVRLHPDYISSALDVAKVLLQDKNKYTRCHDLLLLDDLLEISIANRGNILNLATEAFRDKAWEVRRNTLYVLETAVKADQQYTTSVYETAMKAMKDKSVEVRSQAINLLEAMLAADASYQQDSAMKNLLEKASKEKKADIGKKAQELLDKYF